MASSLGTNSPRLTALGALVKRKGHYDRDRFAFEGATLLREAEQSGLSIEELFVTRAAYDATPLVQTLDAGGTPTFVIEEKSAARISDLETPPGIIAVASRAERSVTDLLATAGLVLVLADINDPGNAGTLVRSAEAFGASGVVFGRLGVDPYHPKVVRSAMGSIFRLTPSVADPPELARAALAARVPVVGLTAGGESVEDFDFGSKAALVVGHERHGLGRWVPVCERSLALPMRGAAESLNAAVAGSIALYEAARNARREDRLKHCQESVGRVKSQD
jgi:RNA methyltransferase, TrmH family